MNKEMPRSLFLVFQTIHWRTEDPLMKLKIFPSKDDHETMEILQEAWEDGKYEHCISYMAKDIDDVFKLGNTHDAKFNDPFACGRLNYSMSVGDVVLDQKADKWYLCLMKGWREVLLSKESFCSK